VFGKNGLLGDAFFEKISSTAPLYKLYAFDHARADISNRTHVAPIFNYIKPTVVINCAAINDVDLCEDAQAGAMTVNAVGPEILAEECEKVGAKLVHISACTVFDGNRTSPYTEKCAAKPINAHGLSKLEGEKGIFGASKDHLIIRPGWCFHYEGDNIVTDWVSRADRRLNIPVHSDCHGSPTYVPDLIDATLALIEVDATGVFHVANSTAATFESFADAVVSLTGGGSKVVGAPKQLEGWSKAPFPKYNVLSTTKYSKETGARMRPWSAALKECLFKMHRFNP